MLVLLLAVTMVATQTTGGRLVYASDSNFVITGDQTTPTNKDIKLNLKASDALSGVQEITLPDGSKITELNSTYTITKNGTYTFKVIDKAGNETVGDLIVKNIFKTVPTLTLSADVTTPTNQDVTISTVATAIGEGNGIKQIINPPGTTLSEDGKYVVTQNGTYVFKAIDSAGNEIEKTIEIGNINKVLPVLTIEPYNTDWTNQDITVTASADKGTLNAETHKFTKNETFTFTVVDEYGNRAEKTITITNIDKAKPTIEIKIGEGKSVEGETVKDKEVEVEGEAVEDKVK